MSKLIEILDPEAFSVIVVFNNTTEAMNFEKLLSKSLMFEHNYVRVIEGTCSVEIHNECSETEDVKELCNDYIKAINNITTDYSYIVVEAMLTNTKKHKL